MIAIVSGTHRGFEVGFAETGFVVGGFVGACGAGGGTRRSRMGVLEVWAGAGAVLMKKVTGTGYREQQNNQNQNQRQTD